MTGLQHSTFKTNLASKKMLAVLFASMLFFLASCGQSVDQISIAPRGNLPPPSSSFGDRLFNVDLSGTSLMMPISTSRVLIDHSTGGSSLRTASSSLSYRMTSGVGVE